MQKLIVTLISMFSLTAFAAQLKKPVDLMLVIAVDTSGSVDEAEYKLQHEGVLQALEDPELAYIVEKCNGGGMALTYVEWSGHNARDEVTQKVDWHFVRNRHDLKRMAANLRANFGRELTGRDTDILNALRFSSDLMAKAPYEAARKIINLSSDGTQSVPDRRQGYVGLWDNDGMDRQLRVVRDEIVSKGEIIDTLVIRPPDESVSQIYNTSDSAWLKYYFEYNVRGGKGSILEGVQQYEEYAAALKSMLIRELNFCMF